MPIPAWIKKALRSSLNFFLQHPRGNYDYSCEDWYTVRGQHPDRGWAVVPDRDRSRQWRLRCHLAGRPRELQRQRQRHVGRQQFLQHQGANLCRRRHRGRKRIPGQHPDHRRAGQPHHHLAEQRRFRRHLAGPKQQLRGHQGPSLHRERHPERLRTDHQLGNRPQSEQPDHHRAVRWRLRGGLDHPTSSGAPDIKAQVYNSAGLKVGSEFLVNTASIDYDQERASDLDAEQRRLRRDLERFPHRQLGSPRPGVPSDRERRQPSSAPNSWWTRRSTTAA